MPIASRRLWGIAVMAILFTLQSSQKVQSQDEVLLASAGRATMPVVVRENADPQVLEAAEELAEVLGRISGAAFRVETSRG